MKNGANFTALCPFHKEKSLSFNVNPHKGRLSSLASAVARLGGDVFTFVKDYENIGFMDAVRWLAERAKIPLEFENTPGARESRHLEDQLIEIHRPAFATRWQNCLVNEAAGALARDYLAKRGVSAGRDQICSASAPRPTCGMTRVNWAKGKGW